MISAQVGRLVRSSLANMTHRGLLYPTLIALVSVLDRLVIDGVEPVAATRILVVAITVGIMASLLARMTLGDPRGGPVAAVIVMALVAATTPLKALAFLLALALLLTEWAWSRRKRLRLTIPWPSINRALNWVLVVLLVMVVGRGIIGSVQRPLMALPTAWTTHAAADSPDIFVILADGHGSADVMHDGYGYDLAELRSTLSAQGFHESPSSHANHSRTRYSLAVLLNGRPLAELGQDMKAPVNESIVSAALHDLSAIRLLQNAGYHATVIGSGYEQVGLRDVGHFIDVGPRNEFEQAFLTSTALGMVIDQLSGGSYEAARTRTLAEIEQFDELMARPDPGPRFVFLHLPAPHWPFVFEADCSARPVDGSSPGGIGRAFNAGNSDTVRAFRDQTACVDHLMSTTVRSVVERDPGAVILVMSDHGPEERLDWWHPAEPGIGDRMANLFWARTPGRPQLFPNDITLVNVMPILFNAYLGTDLPLHANDLWFGPPVGVNRFIPYPVSPS
jgi:hypothetical protein